ncbi:MAG: hypothetical protein IH986_10790, partial [Planctomycetes bacterium]|nr:hypothetical protein [Planctomycetota bacterium]
EVPVARATATRSLSATSATDEADSVGGSATAAAAPCSPAGSSTGISSADMLGNVGGAARARVAPDSATGPLAVGAAAAADYLEDDDPVFGSGLEGDLRGKGFAVKVVHRPSAAEKAMAGFNPGVCLVARHFKRADERDRERKGEQQLFAQ